MSSASNSLPDAAQQENAVKGIAISESDLESVRAKSISPKSFWKTFLKKTIESRLGRKLLDIFYETVVMIFYIGAIALLHSVLDRWLGKDAKFFNYIPISFIIDFAHVLVIVRFLLEIAKDMTRDTWKK